MPYLSFFITRGEDIEAKARPFHVEGMINAICGGIEIQDFVLFDSCASRDIYLIMDEQPSQEDGGANLRVLLPPLHNQDM
jgi:hypothetical protein